ncbi:hypothetical protein I1A62_36970 [Rhodococcus sp. USK10]|uniref:hypothetical protein n=1 Tax=Rhodococcus sp. USK10 TaxID=2789739 RepID=UPI001C5F8BEC|nr:hypothetical protein [Rhodococcus sp. USK10]QYB02730.1 hypothetical protein I1A62_36970 [Rhodococcus sp. USK10]
MSVGNKFVLAVGLGATLVLAGCGSDAETGEDTFAINGTFSANAQAVNQSAGTCKFYDGWFRAGLPVLLKGADNSILGKTELTLDHISANSNGSGVCTFNFAFEDVKAGETAYQLFFSNLAPVIQSEDDLREWPNYSARDAFSVLGGNTEQVTQNER